MGIHFETLTGVFKGNAQRNMAGMSARSSPAVQHAPSTPTGGIQSSCAAAPQTPPSMTAATAANAAAAAMPDATPMAASTPRTNVVRGFQQIEADLFRFASELDQILTSIDVHTSQGDLAAAESRRITTEQFDKTIAQIVGPWGEVQSFRIAVQILRTTALGKGVVRGPAV